MRDRESPELEECVRDLIMGCFCSSSRLGFNGSCSGVQKITLIPCSEKMREWLVMHVKEMGSSPYLTSIHGLSALFSSLKKECNFFHAEEIFFSS